MQTSNAHASLLRRGFVAAPPAPPHVTPSLPPLPVVVVDVGLESAAASGSGGNAHDDDDGCGNGGGEVDSAERAISVIFLSLSSFS